VQLQIRYLILCFLKVICAALASLNMPVTRMFVLFLFNFLFTGILIQWPVFECECGQGTSNLLVFAIRNEPSALVLVRTVSEYRKGNS
jgi:hypothetical protein